MNLYQSRLELTWTNKPVRLLAHEDGRYEWSRAEPLRTIVRVVALGKGRRLAVAG
ncbi:MAG: hypothetical protein ACLQHS_05655 [Candidatus Limnocylindrales bacterium]